MTLEQILYIKRGGLHKRKNTLLTLKHNHKHLTARRNSNYEAATVYDAVLYIQYWPSKRQHYEKNSNQF